MRDSIEASLDDDRKKMTHWVYFKTECVLQRGVM
jgi:hypothetical protein